jgi:hypothetical protein
MVSGGFMKVRIYAEDHHCNNPDCGVGEDPSHREHTIIETDEKPPRLLAFPGYAKAKAWADSHGWEITE